MKTKNRFKNGWKGTALISVFSLTICFALLVSVCFGWFMQSVAKEDVLQASVFVLDAQINEEGGDNVTVTPSNGVMTAELEAGKTYRVTLTCSAETNGLGCCKVAVAGREYQTETFGKGGNGADKMEFSFSIVVPTGEGTQVQFTPQWGSRDVPDGVQAIAADAVISLESAANP